MIELQGKYNTAKVFTDNVDEKAIGQVIEMLNEELPDGIQIKEELL